MFSPIRRSSLYLALWRFDISVSNLLCAEGFRRVPGRTAGNIPCATAASPGCGVHCAGARLDGKGALVKPRRPLARSEEHTSELQSLMRISYAVFCLKKQITLTTEKDTLYRNDKATAHTK